MRRVLAVVAIGLVASACAHGDPARRSWHEVRTARVVLVTDLDRDDARERAAELDELTAALTDLYELVRPEPPAPLRPARVVLFAGCIDMEGVGAARSAAGITRVGLDFDLERLVVTCDERGWQRVALHELTHDLNARYFRLPAWLEEGLAEYYSTIEIEDGMAVVGRAPDHYKDDWNNETPLPSLGRLLSMPHRELVEIRRKRGYFAAWYLTQMLATDSVDSTRRFQRLLSSLAAGTERGAAFATAFGDVSARIAEQYAGFGERRQLMVRHVPYRRRPAGRIASERTLRAGEAHALFIQLAPLGAGMADFLRDRIARLERDDPTWSRRLYWRALVAALLEALHERRVAPEAIRALRDHVRTEPGDANAWLGLVALELASRQPTNHLGFEPVDRLEEIEAEVGRLSLLATRPAHLAMVAEYHMLRGWLDSGRSFVDRALTIEPACWDCWDVLARIHFRAGRPRDAVMAQERAIALSAERHLSAAMEARLRHFRRAAARAGNGAPAASGSR